MLILSFFSIFFWKLVFFSKKNRNVFLVLSCFTLFVFSASRDISEGIDLPVYIDAYHRYSRLSFENILALFSMGEMRDPAFWLISSSMAKLGLSERIWLSIISLFFSFSIYRMIKSYAVFPLISLALMISLGYLGFSYSGLRQTVALSFVIFSVPFLFKGEYFKFVLLILIASAFHLSAIVAIIFPFLNFRMKIYYYYLGVFLSLCVAVFFAHHVRILVGLIGGSQYSGYQVREEVLNFTGVMVYLSLFAFCLARYKYVVLAWEKVPFLYNVLLCGFLFQCLSLVIAEMFRVAMYFNIFYFILVGFVLMSISSKLIRYISFAIIVFCCCALFFVPNIS